MSIKTNAIIYSRKSRSMEGMNTHDALENQRETLLAHAKNKNYTVLEIFEEVASSVDEEREQFQAMVKMIHSGEVDVVVVSAIDRIARSLGIFEKFIQVCKDYNVLIETPQSQIDLSNEGSELLALIQSVLAKSEYGQIKRRLTEGKLSTVQVKHRWIGSTAPFGYKYDRDKKILVPDDETKHIYRKMVEFALDGVSFSEIAKRLNEGGYNTLKGNPWNVVRVQKILKNRTYLGEAEYNSVTLNRKAFAKNCHEPLITESEYNKIIKYASERNNFTDRSRVGEEKTIIDGLVYCGECKRKRSIYIQKTTEARKRKTPFYMIRACHHPNIDGSRCQGGGCKSAHVEELVIDFLKKYKDKLRTEYENMANSASDDSMSILREKIKSLEKDLAKNEESLKRVTNAYVNMLMDLDEFGKWKNDLFNQKTILENELNEANNMLKSLDVRTVAKHIKSRIDLINEAIYNDDLSIRETNNALKMIIKRIEVYKVKGEYGNPDKVKITTHDII